MWDTVKIVTVAILGVLYGLSALSRRFPDVDWLQHFRFERPQLSEEHRASMRRRANVLAGVQLILMGVGLPLAYVVLTVMMFNDITAKAMTMVLAGSVLCVGLGITAIVRRNRG
jgi:integral membrane sensor domain MASE1